MDAAKIVLHHPAYVDPLGNLWITHPAGRPMLDVIGRPIVDHTAVVRERVRLVRWPTDGVPTAIVGEADHLSAVVPAGVTPVTTSFPEADWAHAIQFAGGALVPTRSGAVLLYDVGPGRPVGIPPGRRDALATAATQPNAPPLAVAPTFDGLYFWSTSDDPAKTGVGRIENKQLVDLSHAAGWPEHVREIIPLADDSVLVLYDSDEGPALKLIPAADKPPTPALRDTVTALARQLADVDPLKRDAATRALEAQGPAAYPVLESIRDALAPEAQVRIEALLGQRFAPTLGGLRPLPGKVRTLGRFPGGGCVLRFDGGGTVGGTDDQPERSVIPATVLIRPGLPIELIDPAALTDFVPGRQSIQWVGGQLIVSDPKVGPRRWLGLTLQPPLLPKELADFDTVVAIDARRRWLLKSDKRPGDTLLIDPTLPDPTPRLPVWTISAPGGSGRTATGWPAVRKDDDLFVLEREGWKKEKAIELPRPTPATQPVDAGGPRIAFVGSSIQVTDNAGHQLVVQPPGSPFPSGDTQIAAAPGRLFVYTADGRVHRYAVTPSTSGPVVTFEKTFTAGVPANVEQIWIDPAGRLVMQAGTTMAIGFPDGRLPAALRDLMLRVDR